MPTINFNPDDTADESGVSHESIANTDNSDDTTIKQGYTYGDVDDGLVFYAPMERGQSTHLHDAALDNHGVINGASWTTDTPFGDYALEFVASNSEYVLLPSSFGRYINGPFTISLWVNLDSTSSEYEILRGDDSDSSSDVFLVRYSPENSAFQYQTRSDSGNDITSVLSSTSPSSGTWYHVVAVRQADGTMRIYVDGFEENSESGTTGTINTNVNGIGADVKNGQGYIDGKIAYPRVYDRALSSSHIQTLYQRQAISGTEQPVPTLDEAAHYKLDGDATDSSGNGLDGTNNGVTFVNDALYGQAGDFNPSESDYVNLPFKASVPNLGTMSISAWVYDRGNADGTATELEIVANYDGSNGTLFRRDYSNSGGDLQFWVDGSTNQSTVSVPEKQWTHVAVSYDGSTIYFYKNGEIEDTVAFSGSNTGSANNSDIGQRGDNAYYADALIDDVRILDYAISPIEVERLFHAGSWRIDRENTL